MADSSNVKVNSPASIPHKLHGRRPIPSSVSGEKQTNQTLTKESMSYLHDETSRQQLSFHHRSVARGEPTNNAAEPHGLRISQQSQRAILASLATQNAFRST